MESQPGLGSLYARMGRRSTERVPIPLFRVRPPTAAPGPVGRLSRESYWRLVAPAIVAGITAPVASWKIVPRLSDANDRCPVLPTVTGSACA